MSERLLFGEVDCSSRSGKSIGSIIGVYTPAPDCPPLFRIKMPCGHEFTLKPGDKIPDADVPCTCGDAGHFFWRVEKP